MCGENKRWAGWRVTGDMRRPPSGSPGFAEDAQKIKKKNKEKYINQQQKALKKCHKVDEKSNIFLSC